MTMLYDDNIGNGGGDDDANDVAVAIAVAAVAAVAFVVGSGGLAVVMLLGAAADGVGAGSGLAGGGGGTAAVAGMKLFPFLAIQLCFLGFCQAYWVLVFLKLLLIFQLSLQLSKQVLLLSCPSRRNPNVFCNTV